ncbi:MAG: DUF2330 domain-containing protein [Byssovorax sp.]
MTTGQDPAAHKAWLADHQFTIPPGAGPIIDTYVAEGFDFIAMKLAPDQGIQAMRPVRITSEGAGLTLPLRMIGAGVKGAVPITLWVIGEGRYEPVNFPGFRISESDLVWSWDTASSNYRDLVKTGFAMGMGDSWLIDAGESQSRFPIADDLTNLAKSKPVESGYADAMGMGASDACAADLGALFNDIPGVSIGISRMRAELSPMALGADLQLGAGSNQGPVQRDLVAKMTTGKDPCEAQPTCPGDSSGAGGASAGSTGGCAVGGERTMPALLGGLLAAIGLSVARRRTRPGA